jgi:vancomycin resistance protein VanJ
MAKHSKNGSADVPRRASLGQMITRLLLAAADVYLVFMVLYVLLHALGAGGFWPVALFQNIAHWLLLPSFVLVVLFIWRGHRWRVALAGLNVVAFIVFYGGLFLPNRPARCDGDCLPLTVLTYNLGSGLARYDALVDLLRESDADIIALEELTVWQADDLEATLPEAYPYRALHGDSIYGKGLLSRYPILEESGPIRLHTFMTHMVARLDVDGQPLTVIIAHPPRPIFIGTGYFYPPGTSDDYHALAALATSGEPTLMLGDFNANDQSDLYRVLKDAGLHDTFREAGRGFGSTYPQSQGIIMIPLLVRIDYIWHTDHFTAARAWVGPDAGSDHRPLLAELVWQR